MTSPSRPLLNLLPLLALLWLLPHAALAEVYDFEVVIFERPGAGEASPSAPDLPDRSMASGTLSASALPAAARRLGPVAYTLGRKGMTVHEHVAWRQTPGRRDGGSWRWIEAGRLSGLIRVTRGRFLHLDADLLLRDPARSVPHRIRVSRRFRSDELHYVDHPKVGIVIEARRVKASSGGAAADAAAGEPKPAEPDAAPR